MDAHPLKSLLQYQLATDASTTAHLPYVLAALTEQCLEASSHTPKWSARLSSLLHSKESSARWAALCLCLRTAELSKSMMIDCSQGWISASLPMLSKPEPVPTWRAAIRLLHYLLTYATSKTEFQRQVLTPNVPKFVAALLALASKDKDNRFHVQIMDTLRDLLRAHPTLLKQHFQQISTLSLKHLNGGTPTVIHPSLLDSAASLFAALPLTGGKVGSSSLWKKSMEETIILAKIAVTEIRTTFPSEDTTQNMDQTKSDPLTRTLLNLDRLRCCSATILKLLRVTTQRPVQVPIGKLQSLILLLLSSSIEEQSQTLGDPAIRALEASIVPDIWNTGCSLLEGLCKCVKGHLTPNSSRFLSIIAYQLEQKMSSAQKTRFMMTARTLIRYSYSVSSSLPVNRLVKVILPNLTPLVARSDSWAVNGDVANVARSNRSKKRSRAFEGDELLRGSAGAALDTPEDELCVLMTVDMLRILVREPNLSASTQSLLSRVIVSLLLSLPQTLPASLSANYEFYTKLSAKIQEAAMEIGLGNSIAQSRTLGLMISSATAHSSTNESLELVLHPRLPPLVRSMPPIEAFTLTESREEADLREELGLSSAAAEMSIVTPNNAAEEMAEELPVATLKPSFSAHPAQPTQIGFSTHAKEADTSMQIDTQLTHPTPPSYTQPIVAPSTSQASPAPPPAAVPVATVATATAIASPVNSSAAEASHDDEEMPLIDDDSDSDLDSE